MPIEDLLLKTYKYMLSSKQWCSKGEETSNMLQFSDKNIQFDALTRTNTAQDWDLLYAFISIDI